MKVDGDSFTLSTGRHFCANCGIIGLSEPYETEWEGKMEWHVSEGYDGGINLKGWPNPEEPCEFPWTREEKQELADYMIDLWQRFKRDA